MALIHGAEFRECSEEEFLKLIGKPTTPFPRIPDVLDVPPGPPSSLSKAISEVMKKPPIDLAARGLKFNVPVAQ